MAHWPAQIGTEAVHGILQSLATRGGLVGSARDVLHYLQQGGALLDPLFEGGLRLLQRRGPFCHALL